VLNVDIAPVKSRDGQPTQFLISDAYDLHGLDDAHFSLALGVFLLEHMTSTLPLAKALFRVLESHGHVVLVFPVMVVENVTTPILLAPPFFHLRVFATQRVARQPWVVPLCDVDADFERVGFRPNGLRLLDNEQVSLCGAHDGIQKIAILEYVRRD
jgi:hypothetical protein